MKHPLPSTLLLLLLTTVLAPAFASAAPAPEAVKAALESLPVSSCGNFVRFDDAYIYLGYGPYRVGMEDPRHAHPSGLTVARIDDATHPMTFPLQDSAVDAVRVGDALYVLTYSGIEEWSLASRARVAIHATTGLTRELQLFEHPQAFALQGDRLVIAHGILGLSVFDIAQKRLVWEKHLIDSQAPRESAALDVVVQGKTAYVLLNSLSPDGFQQGAFRGIVVADTDSRTISRELNGNDPGADSLATAGNKLLIGFGGDLVWKYALSAFGAGNGRRMPSPERRVFQFPEGGHLEGKAALDSRYLYTCFVVPAAHAYQGKASLRALDRKALHLD